MLLNYKFSPKKFDGVLINKTAYEKGFGVWDVIVANTSFTFATIRFINECIDFGIVKENLVDSIITDLDLCVSVINGIPCLRNNSNTPKVYVLKVKAIDAYNMLQKAKEKLQIKVEVMGYYNE
jgi:hypothetical protein